MVAILEERKLTDDGLQELISEQIDHWLTLWWRCGDHGSYGMAYPKRAPGTSMYRASRQMDDMNGALDDDADAVLAEAIGGVIDGIRNPYQAALYQEARNLCSSRVWSSARIPQDQQQTIVRDAREMLWMRMSNLGLA